jgi:ABC-type phosphate/phosphonate transport system permease subunit
MDNTRRIILIVYCIAVAIASIYVPWRFINEGKEFSINYYTLIWSPLSPAVVDFQRVILELISITAIAGIALLIGDPKFRKKL